MAGRRFLDRRHRQFLLGAHVFLVGRERRGPRSIDALGREDQRTATDAGGPEGADRSLQDAQRRGRQRGRETHGRKRPEDSSALNCQTSGFFFRRRRATNWLSISTSPEKATAK